MTLHEWLLFIITGLTLNLIPGADMLYVISQTSAGHGRAGVWAALGITAGCFVHILLAVFGLSALILQSAEVYTFFKWLGALYLGYLGLSMLLRGSRLNNGIPKVTGSDPVDWKAGVKILGQGTLINALNPKVALFFLALLPQFVDPGDAAPALTLLLLGVVFNLNSLVVLLIVVAVTAKVAQRINHPEASVRTQRWPGILRKLGGMLFLGLGARQVLDQEQPV